MNNDAYGKIVEYIDHNPIATIGTINLDGTPHGAIVYICADDRRHTVYFLTKMDTQKYKNLSTRDMVSITIANPSENSTLQANGRAVTIRDGGIIDMVTKKITRAHASAPEWLPPIAKLHAGAYVIVGVEIWHARIAHFKGMSIGDEHIFTRV